MGKIPPGPAVSVADLMPLSNILWCVVAAAQGREVSSDAIADVVDTVNEKLLELINQAEGIADDDDRQRLEKLL